MLYIFHKLQLVHYVYIVNSISACCLILPLGRQLYYYYCLNKLCPSLLQHTQLWSLSDQNESGTHSEALRLLPR